MATRKRTAAPKKEAPAKAEEILYCSFCGKSQHSVKRLIAGPVALICDECVELCNEILQGDGAAPNPLTTLDGTVTALLVQIKTMHERLEGLTEQLIQATQIAKDAAR